MYSRKILAVGGLSLLAAACSTVENPVIGGGVSSAVAEAGSSSSVVVPESSSFAGTPESSGSVEVPESSSSAGAPVSSSSAGTPALSATSSSVASLASSSDFAGGSSASVISTIDRNTKGIECVVGDSTFGIVDTSQKFFCMTSSVTGEPTWNVLPVVPGEKGVSLESWRGNESMYRLELGNNASTHTSGYWYVETDSLDGGASRIEWPAGVELGNEYSADALDNVIDYCGGVCGTFHLDRGSITYNPFVSVGFDLTDKDGDLDVGVDVYDWEGVCITYTSDVPVSLVMDFGEKGGEYLGYDLPYATLPKAATISSKDIRWGSFKQDGWGKAKISGEDGARSLVSLKFKIQATDKSSGQFAIRSIGTYRGGCR